MRAHLKAQSRNGSSDQNARWNEKLRSGQRSAALSDLRLEQRTAAARTKNRRSPHQSLNGLAKPVLKKKFSGRVMRPAFQQAALERLGYPQAQARCGATAQECTPSA